MAAPENAAALALIESDDEVLCLGDIVGYGPNPNECVAKIRELATATVLGNHDVAAIDNFGLAYFNPAAREAMRWTQRMINEDSKAWLNSLSSAAVSPKPTPVATPNQAARL